jgi:hypothetical protein
VSRPDLEAALATMIETHLAPIPELLLPIVVRLLPRGGGWLYAYASDQRALRIQLSAIVLHQLGSRSAQSRAVWELRRQVVDLAANFRSRLDRPLHYYGQATRTHAALTRPTLARRNTGDGLG